MINQRDPIVQSIPKGNGLRSNILTFLVHMGLYLLLLSIPFHSVLIVEGISVFKAVGLAFAPLWGVWILAKLSKSRWVLIVSKKNIQILLSLVAFIFSILLSSFYCSLSPLYWKGLTSILLLSTVPLLLYMVISSESALRLAYACLALGGIILSFLTILQFLIPNEISQFFGQNVFSIVYGTEIAGVRATGAFRDPNYGAFTIIVLMCYTFFLSFTYKKGWLKNVLILSVVMEVVAIALTFSRGGYITLALLFLIILKNEKRKIHVRRIIIWQTILGIALLAIMGRNIITLLAERTKTLIEFTRVVKDQTGVYGEVDLSLWYRLNLLIGGISMALDKFPLGVGWENFYSMIDIYVPGLPERGAHNTYIAIASELGLPGVIAFSLLLYSLLTSISGLTKLAQGDITFFSRGTKYALLAIIINGFFLTVFYEAVVWVTIGLIMVQNKLVYMNSSEKFKND
jgi:O-antigen ligase